MTGALPQVLLRGPALVGLFSVVSAIGPIPCNPAFAQEVVEFETRNNLDVEHLEPRALGFVTLGRASTLELGEWAVGGFIHYANSPLVLFEGSTQIGEVVRHRLTIDLVGAFGLLPWLEAQAALPFVVFQGGDEGLPTGDLPVAGLKDLRLALKLSFFDQEKGDLLGLALRPEVFFPTGDEDAFLGAGAVRFFPSVIVDKSFAWLWGVHFAANLGLNLRSDADVGNVEIADELVTRWGTGIGLPGRKDLRPLVFFELATTTRLSEPFAEPEQNPVVGRVGLRLEFGPERGGAFHGTGGVSAGTTRGYGTPDVQVFTGLVYARTRADRDHDGILDAEDACPDDPEDRDGFEDEDGCPDPDNDQDGILDVDDACPDEPEDFDGFDDTDGCPEEDADLDGVPEPLDACPDEPETINGFEDDDGCPDEGPPHVEVTTERVTIDSKIQFDFDSARIKEESFNILNQVAQTIKANPQLKRIRVEGHTDERGSAAYNLDLSRRRAKSVLDYLASRGVSRTRLESDGYGEERPLEPGTGEEVWAKNRRVEFTILERNDEE
ncbi:MAG: OmpA family protein [Myxococcota bacterium]